MTEKQIFAKAKKLRTGVRVQAPNGIVFTIDKVERHEISFKEKGAYALPIMSVVRGFKLV